MKRETTNHIRFVIEDLLPPIVRDSTLFKGVASSVWGNHIQRLALFRQRAAFLSPEEYEALYRAHPRVHDETDNSVECVRLITEHCVGESVCDVGCGTGFLLKQVTATRRVGVDIAPPENVAGI